MSWKIIVILWGIFLDEVFLVVEVFIVVGIIWIEVFFNLFDLLLSIVVMVKVCFDWV